MRYKASRRIHHTYSHVGSSTYLYDNGGVQEEDERQRDGRKSQERPHSPGLQLAVRELCFYRFAISGGTNLCAYCQIMYSISAEQYFSEAFALSVG